MSLALNQASELRDQAAAAPEDVARWEAAAKGVDRASNTLDDDAQAELASRLLTLRNAVQAGLLAARRDQTLLDAVADVEQA